MSRYNPLTGPVQEQEGASTPRTREPWQELTYFIDHPAGWRIMPIHYSQDPDVDEEILRNEKALYTLEEDWEMEMEINVMVVSGVRCYPTFVYQRFVRSKLPYDPTRPIILTCDFNVRLMVWEVCQIQHGRLCVIDEIAIARATARKAAQEFADRYSDHVGGVEMDGDFTGRNRSYAADEDPLSPFEQVLAILRTRLSCDVKFVARPNPSSEARIKNLNDALLGPNEEPQILVSTRCGYLIRDFLEDVWDKKGTDSIQVNDENDPLHVLTHAAAALGYTAWRILPSGKRRRAAEAIKKPREKPIDLRKMKYRGRL